SPSTDYVFVLSPKIIDIPALVLSGKGIMPSFCSLKSRPAVALKTGGPVRSHTGKNRLTGFCAVNKTGASKFSRPGFKPDEFHGDVQLIPRQRRLFKPYLVNTGEISDLAIVGLNVKDKKGRRLRHCFHLQHTLHWV